VHVVFIDVDEFLAVDFFDGEDFGKLSKSNFPDPFADFLNSPLGGIVDFPLKGKEEVVSRGKGDDGFIDEVLEEFGFEDFVLVEILVGKVLIGLLLKVADKSLVVGVEEVGFAVADHNLGEGLMVVELDEVVLEGNVVQENEGCLLVGL
jgi:hypothetical protein